MNLCSSDADWSARPEFGASDRWAYNSERIPDIF